MFLIRKMANHPEKMKSFYIKAIETSTDSFGWNGEKVNGFCQLSTTPKDTGRYKWSGIYRTIKPNGNWDTIPIQGGFVVKK